jgi:hypothetical protein
MSDRRFTFNPPYQAQPSEEQELEERDESLQDANPMAHSFQAQIKEHNVSDPKSHTSEFERNVSSKIISKEESSHLAVGDKRNASLSSVRRSPFGRLKKEDVK